MKHKFVEYIPAQIEEDVLYVSIEYDVAKHKCPCGCGVDVVTSLSPARWSLTYDGETVSLQPSIGNWTHDCKSHYFITNGKVKWAKSMSQRQIKGVIANDQNDLINHVEKSRKSHGFLSKLKNLLGFHSNSRK